MAVTLQRHHLGDLLGAERHHPAHVVAGQVHEHDVLGHLLGMLAQLGTQSAVLLLRSAPVAGAGDRPGDDLAVQQLHHRLGRRPHEGHLAMAEQVHVRARVDLAEHPVDVEGVGVELEVETLRQDHLEDVAGEDVLLGRLHGSLIGAPAQVGGHLGEHGLRIGRGHERLVERAGPVGRQLLEPLDGFVVAPVQAGLVEVVAQHIGVGDERDPLAEVVECSQLADDRQHRLGEPLVVGGRVGQRLHLADHVVAQVAHQAPVQGREVGRHRRPVDAQDGLDGAHDPLVQRDPLGQHTTDHLDGAVGPRDQGGRWAPAHERPPTPPLAVLHRFEEEPRLVVAGEAGERGHGRHEVGQELPPDRDDGILAGQLVELGPGGVDRHPAVRLSRRRRGRSRSCSRCGRPPCPPAPPRTARCRRRSRRTPRG